MISRRLAPALFALALSACTVQQGLPLEQRPSTWAKPISVSGLPNLHQVSPTLFRSAQPLASGLTELNQATFLTPQGKPIKTVVSLRANNGNERIVPATGVQYVQIPFNTWHVKDEDVLAFLRLATNPEQQPVLLHCKHGADRTGMMTAIYRIVVQDWSKADAIAEMRQGGFGYHPIWSNLIRYIENLDVTEWKAKLKQNSPPKTKS